MTDAYAADSDSITVEFHDLVLVSSGYAGNSYSCVVNGLPLVFWTVENPTGSELIDRALTCYKAALMAEHARSVRTAVDSGLA